MGDMRLKLVRFVALLVSLVLPVQGMAAVVAAQCMAFEHHQDAPGHGSTGEASESNAGQDHSTHSHHDGAGDALPDDGGSNGSHCGPCTACCASASISGPVELSIPVGPSNAPYVISQSAPPSVQLDGLDRPPTAL